MDITQEFIHILWDECYASDGFRRKLRAELTWDKACFDRLTEAMRACCKYYALSDGEEKLLQEYIERCRLMSEEERDPLSKKRFSESKRCIPSELAVVFWEIPQFVRDWTAHEYWEKQRSLEPEYFEKAYRRLDKLASWFFYGQCPWDDEEKGWASTFV